MIIMVIVRRFVLHLASGFETKWQQLFSVSILGVLFGARGLQNLHEVSRVPNFTISPSPCLRRRTAELQLGQAT